jgi:hypothetical protein
MIVDAAGDGGSEVVFVNIAGKLDLAALAKIREWDVPGLDALEGLEVEPGK